jgi:hypothetical protein
MELQQEEPGECSSLLWRHSLQQVARTETCSNKFNQITIFRASFYNYVIMGPLVSQVSFSVST